MGAQVGENHRLAKMTEEVVQALRHEYWCEGTSPGKLAEKCGHTAKAIRRAVNYYPWTRVRDTFKANQTIRPCE